MAIRRKNVLMYIVLITLFLAIHTYLIIFKWLDILSFSLSSGEFQGKGGRNSDRTVICVLVLACNRPTVKRCLDSILKARALTKAPVDFPLIVSQDCGTHPETTQVLQSYGKKIHLVHQPNQEEISVSEGENVGYYKQTRHHSWALKHVFYRLKCPAVITLEDDLEVSPDFFEYFAATYPILSNDTSLYCVTASNMQAMPGRVDETATELLHRTDFFFGWGWMITKRAFRSLGRWPKEFWDTWMGLPSVRKGRSCIRPEVPRVKNFGRDGVSGHAFFDSLVNDLMSNDQFIPFTSMNLSYLTKESYRLHLLEQLHKSISIKDLKDFDEDLKLNKYPEGTSFRITYNKPTTFKRLTNYFQIYGKTWNGIAHTQYEGILTFMYNKRRIYLIPGKRWLGYEHFSTFD